jgi:hypothetical protein
LTTTFRPLSFEADDWGYVQEHIPGFLYVEDVRGIVALRNGKIGAMYLFDNWTQTGCLGHHIITNRRVLVEGLMEEVWGWVFSPAGAKRYKVVGSVASDNEPSLKWAKRMGFKELFRIESSICLGVDQVVLEMTKDDCRYA